MAKASSQFVCQQCGYAQVGWAGRCPECGTWGSLVETVTENTSQKAGRRKGVKIQPTELSKVKSEGLTRISSGLAELDRVLGGGIVAGQAILLAGEPGIGKSTLLSQIAEKIYPPATPERSDGGRGPKSTKKPAGAGKQVFYISGEESTNQLKLRTKRLGLTGEGVFVIEETNVDEVVEAIRALGSAQQPNSLVVVDSIQTLSTEDLSGMAGSVGQVRETASRLIQISKRLNIPLFLVGHVTKEGTLAGPRVLEHMVDTVLWFEGDRSQSLRLIRAIKNRFGPTDEVGIFTMEEKGLIAVENPSELFLSGVNNVTGSVPTIIMEGSRPVVVEIQALVVPTKLPIPRRTVQGIDPRRAELLIAVLSRRANMNFFNFDVFINAAGGLNVRQPAADLAIILALASGFFNKPVVRGTAAVGEVGLLGEIRSVIQQSRCIKEAKRLGFKNIVTGNSVSTVAEAVRKYLQK